MGLIHVERTRQNLLKAQGRFKYTPADAPLPIGLAALMEEVGEVARCVLSLDGLVQEDLTLDDCLKELTQVAAITLGMMERVMWQKDQND